VAVRVPLPVTGDPETVNRSGSDSPTLVTVPEPVAAIDRLPLAGVRVIPLPASKEK
jgi:hypothetical protein